MDADKLRPKLAIYGLNRSRWGRTRELEEAWITPALVWEE
jgi:hypothetical protein